MPNRYQRPGADHHARTNPFNSVHWCDLYAALEIPIDTSKGVLVILSMLFLCSMVYKSGKTEQGINIYGIINIAEHKITNLCSDRVKVKCITTFDK